LSFFRFVPSYHLLWFSGFGLIMHPMGHAAMVI
jgi:hypothetical protein